MRNWEDIIKDKLEGYESALPEGSLAEFRARRDKIASSPAKKIRLAFWLTGMVAAAGLAGILFLRGPEVKDDAIQIIQNPTGTVADIPDSTEIEPVEVTQPLLAQAITPKTVRTKTVINQKPTIIKEETETNAGPEAEENEALPEETRKEVAPDNEEIATAGPAASPFIPDNQEPKAINMRIGTVAGSVLGGGVLAALVASSIGNVGDAMAGNYMNKGEHTSYADSHNGQTLPEKNVNSLQSAEYHLPLKVGLSTRIPISERWNITSGLEYSRYSTEFDYSISGHQRLLAHYVGIPVRLDWNILSGKLLDVYIGGGVEGDICAGATLGGSPVKKDGFAFSALGAGGVQLNATKRIGFYLEPEVSWTIPSERQTLATYRKEHPLMFSVATGIRLNLGK